MLNPGCVTCYLLIVSEEEKWNIISLFTTPKSMVNFLKVGSLCLLNHLFFQKYDLVIAGVCFHGMDFERQTAIGSELCGHLAT